MFLAQEINPTKIQKKALGLRRQRDLAGQLQQGIMAIIHSWPINRGQRILYLYPGSGEPVVALAQTGAQVTVQDSEANLFQVRRHAANKDLVIDYHSEELRCIEDESFHGAVCLFDMTNRGISRHITQETARVLKSGGHLHMATWTPEGMMGQIHRILEKHGIRQSTKLASWGEESFVTSCLSSNYSQIKITRKFFPHWHSPGSPADLAQTFVDSYPPIGDLYFELIDRRDSILRDLELVIKSHNMASDGSVSLKVEFLDISAIRK